MATSLVLLSLDIAISQIGEQEKPLNSNWGHPVQDYLASVGVNFPASWCMAFIYWCVDKAAKQLEAQNPLIKTGGVLHQWNDIDAEFKAHAAQIGSIFVMDFGHGLGHCGFVEKIDGEFIHTIDGNTNDTGNREGIEVCRKIRAISKCKGFINI